MFRIQNWKQALGLMALGSVFTIIGMLLSPVTVHRDKFGVIECTQLKVVDGKGKSTVILGTFLGSGFATAYSYGQPLASLGAIGDGLPGDQLTINNSDGEELVRIGPSQNSVLNAGQITIHENGVPDAITLDLNAGASIIAITNKNTPNQPTVA